MTELLDIALSFPTVVFTVLLVPVVALWALTLAGLVDAEILDATDGAIDGALDGAVDGALDGALDAAMDGAADAAADGALDGALDGGHGGAPPLSLQVVQALGVGKVPLSVLVGFSVLAAWVISATLVGFAGPGVLVGAGIALVALVGGTVTGSLVARPLAPLYAKNPAAKRHEFLGDTCTITTGRVDAGFGQAEVSDGGAGLLVQVRCDDVSALGRGDQALIVSFDDTREAFVVTPLNPRSSSK